MPNGNTDVEVNQFLQKQVDRVIVNVYFIVEVFFLCAIRLKTMLSMFLRELLANRIDRRKGSCTPQSVDFSSNENTVLCEKIYPFAVVLRLRVLQIVCGISGIVMGTVAFIEEKSSMNLGIGMPAGLLTVTAAAGSIHTSRGFGGYAQPSCDPPWSYLRFLGPTITSAFALTLLWSSACILHFILLRNSFKALFTSEDLTILAVVLISLTLITLFAAALVLRIDCIYDPD